MTTIRIKQKKANCKRCSLAEEKKIGAADWYCHKFKYEIVDLQGYSKCMYFRKKSKCQ